MLKVASRLQTTTGKEHIGGTDSSRISESDTYVIIIILFEERIGKDAEDVPAVVVPVFRYEPRGNLFELIGKTVLAGHIKSLLQRRRNTIKMLLTIFPKIRAASVLSAARVSHIKDVFQSRIVAGGIYECNACCTAPDIPPHLLVPEVIIRTGRCIWFLRKNHKLLMEGVLIQASRSLEKGCPFSKAAGDLFRCSVCELRVEIQLTRHLYPPR